MSIACRPRAVFWAGLVPRCSVRPPWQQGPCRALPTATVLVMLSPIAGEAFYDLSTVPQRRLLPLASFWNDRFRVHAPGVPPVALPHVRPKVLLLAGRTELFPFRPLSPMRKFRSRAYFPRPGGRWDDDVCQALPALPRLPVRSLPGTVLQHPASPKNSSLHGTRSREQRPRDGGWRKLILCRRSVCLLFRAARLPRSKFPLVTQN